MLCKQCPDERILSNKSIQDVSNMFTLYANHLRKAVTYNWSRLHLKSILRLSNTVQCAKKSSAQGSARDRGGQFWSHVTAERTCSENKVAAFYSLVTDETAT